jgi:hypothetical protein
MKAFCGCEYEYIPTSKIIPARVIRHFSLIPRFKHMCRSLVILNLL